MELGVFVTFSQASKPGLGRLVFHKCLQVVRKHISILSSPSPPSSLKPPFLQSASILNTRLPAHVKVLPRKLDHLCLLKLWHRYHQIHYITSLVHHFSTWKMEIQRTQIQSVKHDKLYFTLTLSATLEMVNLGCSWVIGERWLIGERLKIPNHGPLLRDSECASWPLVLNWASYSTDFFYI